MGKGIFDKEGIEISWCPGCGNFSILRSLKDALAGLGVVPQEVVIVSGIGQAAKTPHFLQCNVFNGLHGRAIPLATGVKACNRGLTVIAEGGDGDMYGEGGNHFIHAIRRNPDITNIVHNNMVYGLTKGQASPTSPRGMVTPVQTHGVFEEPFNPLAVAIALNASFVARAFAADVEETAKILRAAMEHHGYALVDILQPCVTYNKINTFRWFEENTFKVPETYDPGDRGEAFRTVTGEGKLALGVLCRCPERPSFEENLPIYAHSPEPVFGDVRRGVFARNRMH